MNRSLQQLLGLGILLYLALSLTGLAWFLDHAESTDRLDGIEGAIIEFNRGVLDLTMLAADIGIHPGDRAMRQWDRRMNHLRTLLQPLEGDETLGADITILRAQLDTTHQALLRFTRTRANDDIMLLNLLAHAQRLGAYSQAISMQVRDLSQAAHSRTLLDLGIILGLFILVAVIKFSVVGRWINLPLERLSEAAERIGEGDFHRPIQSIDTLEFQHLAACMNRMRERLADLTVSQDRLSEEVERRREAQADAQQAFGKLHDAQMHMAQVEKLTALGTLVGGVAHEINNPLMGIMNYVEYARDRTETGRTREVLERAMVELQRIGRIVRNMLIFARAVPAEVASLPIGEGIHVVLELLHSEMRKHNIELVTDIEPELPPARCDGDTLQQVLINLLINARDAMAKSATRRIEIHAYPLPATRGVAISVADTGSGIEPKTQGRIFDPFFTTKPAGQGTGLGLSVSKQMIEASGGTLRLENRPEGGAMAVIELQAEVRDVVLESASQ